MLLSRYWCLVLSKKKAVIVRKAWWDVQVCKVYF